MLNIYFFTLLHSPYFFYPMVTLLGLLIGSFLNVVISRLPKMLENRWLSECTEFLKISTSQNITPSSVFNLMWPPSHCPQCQTRIKWWENIPVLSYCLLRGHCRSCQANIPKQYLLVEILTALISLIVAFRFGFSLYLLGGLFFSWLLIALTFIDIDKQILPDELTLFGLWLGLCFSLIPLFVTPGVAILGAVLGYLSLWTLYWIFKWLTHKEGLGYGDFKLLACVGAWLGWKMLFPVIMIASFTGCLWGITAILFKKHAKDKPLPFGPFIALGAWATMLFGNEILFIYLKWVY